MYVLNPVKETNCDSGGKGESTREKDVSEREGGREVESHCYNRLKIDQISANDFFFLPYSRLGASAAASLLHSHECGNSVGRK